MLLRIDGLLYTLLVWTACSLLTQAFPRPHLAPVPGRGLAKMSLPRSTSLSSIGGALAESYAGIFAQSPGISKAWAVPHAEEGTETVLLQRNARDIDGRDCYSFHISFSA